MKLGNNTGMSARLTGVHVGLQLRESHSGDSQKKIKRAMAGGSNVRNQTERQMGSDISEMK